MVVEVDVEVDGGVVAGVIAEMVARDVIAEEGFSPYPSMVAGSEGDGGVVVLWRDLVVMVVLEKVKRWWFV